MGTWTGPGLLDALKTRLEARAGLANVTIATGPLGDETPLEAIVFFSINGDQDWAQIGKAALGAGSRRDTYTVEGAIWIAKPGAGELVIKQTRDRAAAVLGELENELRADPSVAGAVRTCQLTGVAMEQGMDDQGRWCQVSFQLGAMARI